jgi:hypothetical protein
MSEEKNLDLFRALVHSFHLQTMMQLGKIHNPMTNKIERDLGQAEISIDMVEMLKTKTAGNLDEPETRFIDAVLAELKLNYVNEKNKENAESSESPTQNSAPNEENK